MIIKIIVYGFAWNGEKSYIKNGWNILDFIIVLVSLTGIYLEIIGQGVATLQLFKMLRILRSLRIISKSEGLKLCVLSLIYSMSGILNVTVVTSLFFFLFGIFSLNLLKGKFYHCQFHTKIPDDLTIVTAYDCINYGGNWQN